MSEKVRSALSKSEVSMALKSDLIVNRLKMSNMRSILSPMVYLSWQGGSLRTMPIRASALV